MIFKRNGWYYLLHGDLCCFCKRGSDAKVLAEFCHFAGASSSSLLKRLLKGEGGAAE